MKLPKAPITKTLYVRGMRVDLCDKFEKIAIKKGYTKTSDLLNIVLQNVINKENK